MADPLITLERKMSASGNDWRLQAWVSESQEIPPEVFLVRHLPTIPGVTQTTAYERVCSYADLLLYCSEALDNTQYYRVRSLDMRFSTLSDLEAMWTELSTGIDTLCEDVSLTSDAEITETSFTYTDLTLTQKIKDSTTGTALAELTLAHATDPALFLVEKIANAEPATDPTAEELIAVASPEDLLTYGTVESDTTYYRKSSILVAAATRAKLDSLLTAIKADLEAVAAVAWDAHSATDSTTATATITSGVTVYSGNPFA